MDEKDEDLLKRLRNRDKEAFRYLYETYFSKMVLFAESFVYDEEEAKDLVQDLFCHLWEHAPRLEVKTSLRSYLVTSLRNRCLNVLRDRKIRDEHKDKVAEAAAFSGLEDEELDEEVVKKLHDALASLPEKMREIILLKIVDEKKNWEIAEELNIAETTVKTQVQRAYRLLRDRLVPVYLLIEWLQMRDFLC